jgi:hypothetical protein
VGVTDSDPEVPFIEKPKTILLRMVFGFSDVPGKRLELLRM